MVAVCLRAFHNLWHCRHERGEMAPPNATDQSVSSGAVGHDPCRPHPTTLQARETMRTITILATIGGAPTWVEMEPWGQVPHPWLAEG